MQSWHVATLIQVQPEDSGKYVEHAKLADCGQLYPETRELTTEDAAKEESLQIN